MCAVLTERIALPGREHCGRAGPGLPVYWNQVCGYGCPGTVFPTGLQTRYAHRTHSLRTQNTLCTGIKSVSLSYYVLPLYRAMHSLQAPYAHRSHSLHIPCIP
eukprot:3087665-Rhodomonas_salina.1